MGVEIIFDIADPVAQTTEQCPNLTIKPEDGITLPPSLGDYMQINKKFYEVVQRGYYITRDPDTNKKSVTYHVVLVPRGDSDAE